MEAGLIGLVLMLVMAFAGLHLGTAMFLAGFFGFAFLRGLDASISLAGTLIFDASMSYGFALMFLHLCWGLVSHQFLFFYFLILLFDLFLL